MGFTKTAASGRVTEVEGNLPKTAARTWDAQDDEDAERALEQENRDADS